MFRTAFVTLFATALLAAPMAALSAAPPPPTKDPKAASSGAYNLDPRHTGVVARVAHAGGFSYSVFRFDKATGTLAWDSAAPANSKLTFIVDPKSITSNVAGFGAELAGEGFLNVGKFPEAKFVSTSARITGAGKGTVTGDFTLMGVTKPVTFEVELVGAGLESAGGGKPVETVGFTAKGKIKRSDFGFTALVGPIGDEVDLTIDTEFHKAA
jgi:polyisoprenoid-binding protein YceI